MEESKKTKKPRRTRLEENEFSFREEGTRIIALVACSSEEERKESEWCKKWVTFVGERHAAKGCIAGASLSRITEKNLCVTLGS